jgi:hypothetical protein
VLVLPAQCGACMLGAVLQHESLHTQARLAAAGNCFSLTGCLFCWLAACRHPACFYASPTACAQEFSTRAVSHNLVASFQENELLEMVRPSLTEAAKGTLMSHGPDAFAARWVQEAGLLAAPSDLRHIGCRKLVSSAHCGSCNFYAQRVGCTRVTYDGGLGGA